MCWLFTHGLAFQANNPAPGTWDEQTLVAMMREGSDAIHAGLTTKLKATTAKREECKG
jgi:hypothetical protein